MGERPAYSTLCLLVGSYSDNDKGEKCLSAIQADSAWRKKEMAIFKGRVVDDAEQDVEPLIRSAVLMLYAHWEGFVKTSSELYLAYINEVIARRSVKLSEHFTDLLMWKKFRQSGEHLFTKNPLPFLLMRKGWPCPPTELLPADVIDTEANLSSKVLKRLSMTIDIEYSGFETKEKLIDESLLKTRNQIAHGERITVQLADYETIDRGIRDLIDLFQQLIETCVQEQKFRAARANG